MAWYGLQIITPLLVPEFGVSRPGKKVIPLRYLDQKYGCQSQSPFSNLYFWWECGYLRTPFKGETSFYLSTSVKQESATPFPCSTSRKEMQPYIQAKKTTTPQATKTIANLLPSTITPPNDRGRLKPMRTPMVLASFLLAIKSPKRLAALCVTDLKAADGSASWPERSGRLADLPQYRGGSFFSHLEFLSIKNIGFLCFFWGFETAKRTMTK